MCEKCGLCGTSPPGEGGGRRDVWDVRLGMGTCCRASHSGRTSRGVCEQGGCSGYLWILQMGSMSLVRIQRMSLDLENREDAEDVLYVFGRHDTKAMRYTALSRAAGNLRLPLQGSGTSDCHCRGREAQTAIARVGKLRLPLQWS
eukprot:155740-Chlamydomonas_euryale.AAC.2